MSGTRVGVIGGGPWGVALARAAARAGSQVTLMSRRAEKDGRLIQVTDSYQEIAKNRFLVVAVPSDVVRDVAHALGNHVDGAHMVVHGIRGLGRERLETISDIFREETPVRKLGALGGPVQVDELHTGTASAIVVGSYYPEVNAIVTKSFSGPWLRVYATSDLRGLEWASAMVGCMAVGVGFAEAAGAGPGLLAALISRAVHDAGRIAVLAGAEEPTIYGLGGYGDLLSSIRQGSRPEVVLGRALAAGKSIPEAVEEAKLRVEAVALIPRIVAFAKQKGVQAPAFEGLARMLDGERGEEILGKFFQA